MIHEKVKWLLIWFSFPFELHWRHYILHTWIFFSLHGLLRKIAFSDIYTLFWVFVSLKMGIVWFWFFPPKQGIQRKRKSLILNSVTGQFWLEVECSFFQCLNIESVFIYIYNAFFKSRNNKLIYSLSLIISNLEFCCELIRNIDIL